jgi:DNA-binding NtrC family response regulator
VYGVVKQSNGFIWVESELGKGATFEIYFPQARERVSTEAPEAQPVGQARGNETVLVVEDEPDVRELAREFLKINGYTVLEARDGVEALEIALEFAGAIHVVVADMVMPRMGGVPLAQKLKSVRPGTKVVWMTGYTEFSSSQPSDGTANPNILQKPFSMESLVGKVREVLANSAEVQPRDPKETYVR